MIDKILSFFEKQAFGVCDYLGEKFGMKSSRIRIYFIYFSFITFGSSLLIYLIIAFWLEHRDLFKRRSRTVWDL